MTKKLVLPPNEDGVYPRCVYCHTEIYMPAVIEYSEGKAIPTCCYMPLPKEYIKL